METDATLESKLADIRIDLTSPTGGRIYLNDEDVTHQVTAFEVRAKAHEITQVWIDVIPGRGEISGPGIVYVREPREDDRVTVVEFLSNIDPATLEAEALEGMGMGDGNVTVALLAKLIDYAKGAS